EQRAVAPVNPPGMSRARWPGAIRERVTPRSRCSALTMQSGGGRQGASGPVETKEGLAMVAHQTLLDAPLALRRREGAEGMRRSSRPDRLDEATKGQIYPQWRRGVPVAVLSRQ